MLRNQKISYEKAEFHKRKNNPEATWDLIKTITNSKKHLSPPRELFATNIDENEAANAVNNYFINIGKGLAGLVQKPATSLSTQIYNKSTSNSMYILETNFIEVRGVIYNLKTDLATRIDYIST